MTKFNLYHHGNLCRLPGLAANLIVDYLLYWVHSLTSNWVCLLVCFVCRLYGVFYTNEYEWANQNSGFGIWSNILFWCNFIPLVWFSYSVVVLSKTRGTQLVGYLSFQFHLMKRSSESLWTKLPISIESVVTILYDIYLSLPWWQRIEYIRTKALIAWMKFFYYSGKFFHEFPYIHWFW